MVETLNIISESYKENITGGPNKVIHNALKGLKLTGHPFTINKDVKDYKYNWIHDSAKGLIEIGLLNKPAILGPNIVVLPKDFPAFKPSFKNCIYLLPCLWSVGVWKLVGFDECPLKAWPVGIDTNDFTIKRDSAASYNNVMIYFKRRDVKLLEEASAIVKKKGYNPIVLKYGSYNEEQYKTALAQCGFGIWIGVSESQGIGMMEALSSNLPLIVCDVKSLFESTDKKEYKFPKTLESFKPTSAPYFDLNCGIIIDEFSKLDNAIDEMQCNISKYNPREYVTENLSLEKQANELVSFFNLLEKQYPEYFSSNFNNNSNEEFKLSFRGKIIYYSFVFKRKTKTVFKILGNKLKK